MLCRCKHFFWFPQKLVIKWQLDSWFSGGLIDVCDWVSFSRRLLNLLNNSQYAEPWYCWSVAVIMAGYWHTSNRKVSAKVRVNRNHSPKLDWYREGQCWTFLYSSSSLFIFCQATMFLCLWLFITLCIYWLLLEKSPTEFHGEFMRTGTQKGTGVCRALLLSEVFSKNVKWTCS